MTAIAIQVSTPDADPAAAPYRISDKPAHDTVTVTATPTTDDASPIGALRVTFNDPDRTAPAVVSRGCVCGIDVCGGEGVVPLHVESGSDVDLDFTYADTGGPPDGTYDVAVHALAESEGWA